MVVIDVRVAQRVHKLAGGQPRHVCDHVREKGVAAREAKFSGVFFILFQSIIGNFRWNF